MEYVVYVIESKERYRYTGLTINIEERLKEHNNKSLSIWTKRGNDWKLVYSEKFQKKSEAYKREKWLKTGKGREYLKKLLG